MADYNLPGGKLMDTPDFGDSVPPTPPNQGGMASVNYVNENTFESGMPPAARNPIESNWQGLVNTNALGGGPVDGYRPTPVGGTYNPGQGTNGRSSKSAMTQGSTERSNASY